MSMIISDKTFNLDNAEYFCKNMIENYKKVVIFVSNPNKTNRRIRIHNIEFGERKIFDDDIIMEAKLLIGYIAKIKQTPFVGTNGVYVLSSSFAIISAGAASGSSARAGACSAGRISATRLGSSARIA